MYNKILYYVLLILNFLFTPALFYFENIILALIITILLFIGNLYLFINYRDTFLEPLFENSEQYIPKTFITKSVYTSISSDGNIGSTMILVGAEEKSISGEETYFDVMIMNSDGCSMSNSMGGTTCEANNVDILDAAAVRPVVVISKEVLD